MHTSKPVRIFQAEELGKIIRVRRKELGYTQEYVAAVMGVSPRLLGEIERGKKTVGIQKVLDYATNMGIDISIAVRGEL